MTRLRKMVCMAIVSFLVIMPFIQPTQANTRIIPAATGVSLTIDFGNSTVRSYSSLDATDVFNLTSMLFDVDVTWAGDRVFVNAIDGVYQDATHGWQYWVNGNYANVAANQYILEDGDSVLWNLTVPNYQTQAELDLSLLVGGSLLVIVGFVFIALLYRRTLRR